jgi:redox-sensitive bicupin YhaK (pirin superfamily)
MTVRPANERLRTRIGWLDSRHTFSFEEHIDPRHMGFRALRVLNDDRIAPAHGFGTQPHRDVELVTYVLEGTLRHRDSIGTDALLCAGDVQRLTAGTGVLHSELNASDTEPLHVLQIRIAPLRARLVPSYERRRFARDERRGRIAPIVSQDGRAGSVTISQDVAISSARLAPATTCRTRWSPAVMCGHTS